MSDFSAKNIPEILFISFQKMVDMVIEDENIFPESATTEDKECLLLYFSSLFILHDTTHDKKFSTDTISDAIKYFYFDAIDDGFYTEHYAQKRYEEAYDLFEKFFKINIEYICHGENESDLMEYISNIVSEIPSCERYNAIGNISLATMIPYFLDVIGKTYDMVIALPEENEEQPETAKDDSDKIDAVEPTQPTSSELSANKTEPENHTTQETSQKKTDWKSKKSTLVLLFFALAVSLIANIYHYSKYTETIESLEYDVSYWKERADNSRLNYNDLMTEYKNMKEEYEEQYRFYENHACIVTDSGSCYHRYGCYHLKHSSFYIYNIENAKYQGYTPCKDCNPPQ